MTCSMSLIFATAVDASSGYPLCVKVGLDKCVAAWIARHTELCLKLAVYPDRFFRTEGSDSAIEWYLSAS